MVTNRSALEELLAHELDESMRSELLEAMHRLQAGVREFTSNTFNIRLDMDASTATIDDELDVDRQSVVSLRELRSLLSDQEAE
ncbi:hypothetical protein [Nocardioides sp. LML1-1-1.1]|uniref:hypothetical protein n=1 Tax=Nocardioides sp. LML1-1-1.1 TaxID=3135248 RepID=UPI00341C82E7